MDRKRLLMDFYLNLLAIDIDDIWRIKNQQLYHATLYTLSSMIDTDMETVQEIFERMASEDK